jgi:hypothetical protein
MAIFIPAVSTCGISGKTLLATDDCISFGAFVYNEADPLFMFSDCTILAEHFHKHPLSAEVQRRHDEHISRNSLENRICAVTGEAIPSSNVHLALGHLTDDPSEPLFEFNYLHFNRSALTDWPKLPRLLQALEDMHGSGAWKGKHLKWLIAQMRPYLGS